MADVSNFGDELLKALYSHVHSGTDNHALLLSNVDLSLDDCARFIAQFYLRLNFS